jgi:hypothetical protein
MRVALIISVLWCSAFAKAQSTRSQCYFVNAENGLNLRQGMGLDYEVIGKLLYSAQVLVHKKEHLGTQEGVLDNGVKYNGNWIQVIPTFSSMIYRNQEMYVFDAYLTKHLTKIPDQSLHNLTELVALHAQDDVEPILGVSSRREMYETGQSCDVSYEYNLAAVKVLIDIILFTVVDKDDYISKKLTRYFQIDTSY